LKISSALAYLRSFEFNDDIQELYEHENKPVIIKDLLDVSELKIALHKDLIIIYIKFTIITDRCDVTNCNQDPFHMMMENY